MAGKEDTAQRIPDNLRSESKKNHTASLDKVKKKDPLLSERVPVDRFLLVTYRLMNPLHDK